MKFSLISILFFVPMLATNYFLIRDAYAQYIITKTELASLGPLATSLNIRSDMENLENLIRIQVQVGVANQNEELNDRIKRLELSLISSLRELQVVALTPAQGDDINAKRAALVQWLQEAHDDATQAKQQHQIKQQLGCVAVSR
ncbi:hypothetical protein [uncultured Pseudomonas sp.]|uniref:hypothetical protein n=1 Tax=uncultured Pseudomonas sp. TaxID=114707 RepID=UPI00261806D7|nr:hypothetical protein [uncultured Pseudomonas sp.]